MCLVGEDDFNGDISGVAGFILAANGRAGDDIALMDGIGSITQRVGRGMPCLTVVKEMDKMLTIC